MNEINKMWSNVLSYRPYVELRKKNYEYPKEHISKKNNNISNTVIVYQKFNPCITLKMLKESVNIAKNNLKIFEEDVSNLDVAFVNSFKLNDTEYIEQVLNENRGIKGNNIFEAYVVCKNDVDFLDAIKNSIHLNYFNNKDENQIIDEHDSCIEKIINNELENKKTHNNYFSIGLDSYVSSLINNYTEQLLKINTNLYQTVAIKREINIDGDTNSINELIEEQFNEALKHADVNMKLYLDSVNEFSNSNLFGNVIKGRERTNFSLNAYSSVDKSSEENYVDVIVSLKNESINGSFDSANQYIKHLMNIMIQRNEYSKYLSLKEGFKNIYSNK